MCRRKYILFNRSIFWKNQLYTLYEGMDMSYKCKVTICMGHRPLIMTDWMLRLKNLSYKIWCACKVLFIFTHKWHPYLSLLKNQGYFAIGTLHKLWLLETADESYLRLLYILFLNSLVKVLTDCKEARSRCIVGYWCWLMPVSLWMMLAAALHRGMERQARYTLPPATLT